jgi:hypothetical protein
MFTGTKSCRTTSTDMADIHPMRDVTLSVPIPIGTRRISTENIYNHVCLNRDLAIRGSMRAPACPADFPCQTYISLVLYLLGIPSTDSLASLRLQFLTSTSLKIAQFLCNVSPFRMNTCKSVSKQRTLTIFKMNTYEKARGRGVSRFRSPRIRFLVTQKRFLRGADAL